MVLFFLTVGLMLGITVWVNKKRNFTESGIANVSKDNMKEFLMAVLVDNDK